MTDKERLKELARIVMKASLYWTGDDEERNPALKTARTLAGLAIQSGCPIDEAAYAACDLSKDSSIGYLNSRRA
jgi:hypothetical protein